MAIDRQSNSSHPSQHTRRVSQYKSLDLMKAWAFGWRGELTGAERTVLSFIAVRGKQDDGDCAWAWFPVGGQSWWAPLMSMSHETLRKTLSRLRKQKLLVDLDGSMVDSRYRGVKGYGIPKWIHSEARDWVSERRDLFYSVPPENAADVTPGHIFVTPGHTDVTPGHTDLPGIPYAATVSGPLYPGNNPGEITQHPYGCVPPSGRSAEIDSGDPVRYEDEWSIPKDDFDDFSVSRESKQVPTRQKKPHARLADLFWDCWTVSREKRVDLATPWSVKKIFLANLKRLLTEHTEAEIEEMIRLFFRKVDNRSLVLKNDHADLWKDFWYNRSALYAAIGKTAAVDALSRSQVAAHNARILGRSR